MRADALAAGTVWLGSIAVCFKVLRPAHHVVRDIQSPPLRLHGAISCVRSHAHPQKQALTLPRECGLMKHTNRTRARFCLGRRAVIH